MKMLKAVLFSCAFFSLSIHAAPAQPPKFEAVPGATVANQALYVRGVAVEGCVLSATPAYQSAADLHVFVVGCDDHPYAYSARLGRLIQISKSTYLRQISSAQVDSNGYVQLTVVGTAHSTFPLQTGVYVGPSGAFSATVSDERFFLDGNDLACAFSTTSSYAIGSGQYVFLIGCDDHPYVYSSLTREISLVSGAVNLKAIHGVETDSNGYAVLLVRGTGNSIFKLQTGIYAL